MKKVFLTLGVIFLVVTLSGCFHDKQQTQTQQGKQDQKNEGSGMSELVDMMTRGEKIKCVYRLRAEDEFEVVTYVDGKKYRTESRMNDVKYAAIFDGKDMHSWMNGQKNGTKMNLECMKDFEMPEGIDQESMKIEEEPMNMFNDRVNLKCEEVNSIDFSVPSDVEFIDQCEMMKKQMKQMEEMQMNIPSL
ncbi:hypothetical protein ACFL2R_00860 [Patescibacteria group bacterium]